MKENCEIIYNDIDTNEEYERTIKKVVDECFKVEELENTNLYISITLTNPEEIKSINRKHRNIDKPTDVLSFPMFEKEELHQLIKKTRRDLETKKDKDIEVEKEDILGDVIISIPKVYEQAEEYGHSFERELAYMVVHGFYHLMGFDHVEEKDKKVMRKKEESILNKLNIFREEPCEKEKKQELDDDEKRTSNKGFLDAWKNAINGIIYATTTQGNVKKQLVIAVIVVIVSLFFELSRAEFVCFMFTIILIIFAEMVNTAIETVVDLYTDLYHPKAKIAKDVAAGGVVITTINAVIVAYFLFFDKISNIGLQFIQNIAKSPLHLAFASIIITVIGIFALIAMAMTNKHKGLNKSFVPSGHTAVAFAANTIIWLTMRNIVAHNIIIVTLSLLLSILVATSRIDKKAHKISEVIFSACVGSILVLIIYGLATAVVNYTLI